MSLAIALGRQAEGLGGSRGHRRHRTRREHRVHSRVDDDGRRAHDTDWADPERDAHRIRGQRADNPRHHIHGFRIPTMLEAPRVGTEVDVVRRRSALAGAPRKEPYPEMMSIWCASDRRNAMDRVKRGERVEITPCDHPLAMHKSVGRGKAHARRWPSMPQGRGSHPGKRIEERGARSHARA